MLALRLIQLPSDPNIRIFQIRQERVGDAHPKTVSFRLASPSGSCHISRITLLLGATENPFKSPCKSTPNHRRASAIRRTYQHVFRVFAGIHLVSKQARCRQRKKFISSEFTRTKSASTPSTLGGVGSYSKNIIQITHILHGFLFGSELSVLGSRKGVWISQEKISC